MPTLTTPSPPRSSASSSHKFGGHKDANAARYGLGLALLDLPERDYQKALEAFTPAANDAKFADRPLALYYAGVSRRGLGQKELAEGVAKPNEMPQRTQAANGHFAEAGRLFTQAREAFEKKVPPDPEWAARARCDTAEMELRLGKTKEARATAEPFVKDAELRQEPVPPARALLPRLRLLPARRHPRGRTVAQPTRPVRPAVRPACPLPHGPGSCRPGREGRGRRSRSTAVLTGYEAAEEGGGSRCSSSPTVQERPVGEGPARSAVKGPRRTTSPARVLRRVPELRGRQVRRGAAEVPGVRQGVRDLAAEGRRRPARRLLPRADQELRRGRQDAPAARGSPEARLSGVVLARQGAARQGARGRPEQRRSPQAGFATAINLVQGRRVQGGPAGRQGDAEAKSRRPEILLELADAPPDREASGRGRTDLRPDRRTKSCCPRRRRRSCSAPRPRTTSPATERPPRRASPASSSSSRTARCCRWCCSAARRTRSRRPSSWPKQNNAADAKEAFADGGDEVRGGGQEVPRVRARQPGPLRAGAVLHRREDWEKAIAALEAIPAAGAQRRAGAGAVRARRLPHPHRPGEGRGRAGGQHAPREADRGREPARRLHRRQPEGARKRPTRS